MTFQETISGYYFIDELNKHAPTEDYDTLVRSLAKIRENLRSTPHNSTPFERNRLTDEDIKGGVTYGQEPKTLVLQTDYVFEPGLVIQLLEERESPKAGGEGDYLKNWQLDIFAKDEVKGKVVLEGFEHLVETEFKKTQKENKLLMGRLY